MRNFILILLIVILFFGCKSTELDKPKKMTLKYTCIIEHKRTNIGLTKTIMSSKVTDFLAGYSLGIDYNVTDKLIKTFVNGDISLLKKDSNFEMKNVNNKTYLVETGSYEYFFPLVSNYKNRYIVSLSNKGLDFWKTYNKLVTTAVKKKAKSGDSGKIVPIGDLIVEINSNGEIIITEKFIVFIL